MIIQLPLENWADLLPFVPRRQLVQLLFQLDDRQFAKILQFFLTKEGQITLGHLRIMAPRKNDPKGGGPIVEVRNEMPPFRLPWDVLPPTPIDLETNLPEGPMPTNVKDFKLIELRYFDMSVATFLRKLQQEQHQQGNSLLDNVNFWFPSSLSPLDRNCSMPYLAQLMPMIGNINSMSIWRLYYMEFGQTGLGPNNAASQLLTTMLTNARILEIYYAMDANKFPWCDWLNTPRNDGKPRTLRLLSASFSNTNNLIDQVKKDFSIAIRPLSFFVYVRALGKGSVQWQDILLDNGQTNERLVVKTFDPPPRDPHYFMIDKVVLISRYAVGANQEWIETNEQEIVGWNFDKQNRRIRFELE